LLRDIDHPKAKEWLKKLDEVDPNIPAFPDVQTKKGKQARAKKQKSDTSGCANLIALIVLGVIGYFIWTNIDIDLSPKPPPDISAMSDVDAARALVDDAIVPDIIFVDVNDIAPAVIVHYDYNAIFGQETYAKSNMGKMLCALRGSGRFDGYVFQFIGKATFVDALGNEFPDDALEVRILPDIIRQVNCENNGAGINWEVVADLYNLHPALR
jgi:hypothetical protein